MNQRKYTIQGVELLPLAQRLKNAQQLHVTDLRSIEARIRETASCQLKKYFLSEKNCKLFIKEMFLLGNITISPTDTYTTAARHIDYLFQSGRVSQGVHLILIFLHPVWAIKSKYKSTSAHYLLQQSDIRQFILFLDDYNLALDAMFSDPEDSLLRHSSSFNYKSSLLPTIAFHELNRLLKCKNNIEKAQEASGAKSSFLDWEHVEKYPIANSEIYVLDPDRIKEAYQLLKQIFIDPYCRLWEQEHKNMLENNK